MGLTNKKVFKDYNTVGVCIMSPTYFSLLLDQDDEKAKFNKKGSVWSRFCVHNLERDVERRWAIKNLMVVGFLQKSFIQNLKSF